jgi:hypothetical protein
LSRDHSEELTTSLPEAGHQLAAGCGLGSVTYWESKYGRLA